jgi:hypothetical protein
MTLRPRVRSAMCDVMAGTDTDMSCKTISDLAVQVATTDSTVKVPGNLRVTNRCAAGNKFMTVAEFAKYASDMIVYNLSDPKTRGRQPSAKC